MVEEVVLEVPPEWNLVIDLIMEDEEGLMITETDTKRKRDKVAQGPRKWQKEDDICLENREHSSTVSWRTQQNSIPKTGMSFNKKKMNGRRQINGRGFHRLCYVADV